MLPWWDGNGGYRSMCGRRAVEGDIVGDAIWTAEYIIKRIVGTFSAFDGTFFVGEINRCT